MTSPTFPLSLTADQLDAVLEGLAAYLDTIDAAPQDHDPARRRMVDALLADLTAARWPKKR